MQPMATWNEAMCRPRKLQWDGFERGIPSLNSKKNGCAGHKWLVTAEPMGKKNNEKGEKQHMLDPKGFFPGMVFSGKPRPTMEKQQHGKRSQNWVLLLVSLRVFDHFAIGAQ